MSRNDYRKNERRPRGEIVLLFIRGFSLAQNFPSRDLFYWKGTNSSLARIVFVCDVMIVHRRRRRRCSGTVACSECFSHR